MEQLLTSPKGSANKLVSANTCGARGVAERRAYLLRNHPGILLGHPASFVNHPSQNAAVISQGVRRGEHYKKLASTRIQLTRKG